MVSAPPDFPHLFPFRSLESALAVPGFWISFDACEPSVCAWHALMCDKNPIGTQKSWTRFQAESWRKLVNGSLCWWMDPGLRWLLIVWSSPFVIVHPHDMVEMIENESSTVMSQKHSKATMMGQRLFVSERPPVPTRRVEADMNMKFCFSTSPGWWSGTIFIFLHILGIIIPTD